MVTARAVALIGFASLFLLALADYSVHPQLFDANVYKIIAEKFAAEGYGTFAEGRTIGYPILLYPLTLLGAPLPLAATLLQGLLYLIVSLWLAAEICRRDALFGRSVLLGLLLNPLNVWALNATLTEAPTLIIFIGLAALLLVAARSRHGIALVILGTGIAAFSPEIRPANAILFAAWCAGAIFLLVGLRESTWLTKSGAALAAAAMAVIASLPQICYNVVTFNSYSPFQIGGLWNRQLQWGIKYAKYGTSADPASYGPLYYHNPLYDGAELPDLTLWWYIENPLQGLGTMVLHTFNGFSFDYHSIYIYDLTPPLPWLFPFIIWIVVVAGVVTLVACWRQIPIFTPAVLFVGLAAMGTIAQNSLTAIENRFNLIPMTVIMVLAACGARRLVTLPRKTQAALVFGTLASAVLLTLGTEAMKLTAPKIIP